MTTGFSTTAPGMFAALGVVLLMVAAVRDVASRTVPNRIALGVALCGVAAQALSDGQLWGLFAAVAAALLVFVAAATMWRLGWMGGADVKLLAAATLLVPAPEAPGLMAAVALAGGLLAIPYLLARRRLQPPRGGRPQGLVRRALRAERWRLGRGGPLPYAVAIACGALLAVTSIQDAMP